MATSPDRIVRTPGYHRNENNNKITAIQAGICQRLREILAQTSPKRASSITVIQMARAVAKSEMTAKGLKINTEYMG